MNMITISLTLNGKDVHSINAEDLEKCFIKAGYLENGIKDVKFIGTSTSGDLMFLAHSYDENQEIHLISRAFISTESAEWEGMPIAEFDLNETESAKKFFNEYKE